MMRMSTTSEIAGVWPVLHLPVDADDQILWSELDHQIEWILEFEPAGLVVLGLATESGQLNEDERIAVLQRVLATAAGRIPILAGIEGETPIAIDRAINAADSGAAGLMVRPPTTGDLVEHYVAISKAAEALPIVVQDAPSETTPSIENSLLVEMRHRQPQISTVKFDSPDALTRATEASTLGFAVIAGWGGTGYLDLIERGAVGCFPGCDLGPALIAIDRASRTGNPEDAQSRYCAIEELLEFEIVSLERLIIGAKTVLQTAGVFSTTRLRSSDYTLSTADVVRLHSIIAALDGVPGIGEAK